jgi:hypothetical protein
MTNGAKAQKDGRFTEFLLEVYEKDRGEQRGLVAEILDTLKVCFVSWLLIQCIDIF